MFGCFLTSGLNLLSSVSILSASGLIAVVPGNSLVLVKSDLAEAAF